jgi:hypothetical protein
MPRVDQRPTAAKSGAKGGPTLSPLNLGSAGDRFIRLILGEATLSLLFLLRYISFFSSQLLAL